MTVSETQIEPHSRLSLGLGELWQYRELFYFFTWRDVKVKYRQTYLGIAWALLQPLLLTLVFTLFFGVRLKEHTDLPYPVFAFSGLLLWNLFAGGLLSAGNGMVSNAHIIQKIYFPRLIVPVSAIMVSVFDFLVALPALGVLLAWDRCLPKPAAPLYFVSGLALAAAATVGAGCWLSALSVKYRDFRYVLPFLVQLLLFMTPVIYPLSYLEATWARRLLALNPMSAAVTMFRGMFSNVPLDWTLIVISVLSAAGLLIQGLRYFRQTEAYFADLA
jgi:lipopolysaccharide transport system permease protein